MIPVLMYHNIVPQTNLSKDNISRNNRDDLDYEKFQQQLQFLCDDGFDIISAEHLYQVDSKQLIEKQKKYAVITFDDGYKNLADVLLSLREKYVFEATIFIIASKIGNEGYLSIEEIKELQKNGFDLQSHGLSHWPLEILSQEKLIAELERSKEIIEKILNKPISLISFPQGSYNSNVISTGKSVGYKGFYTSDIKYYTPKKNKCHIVGRIAIDQNVSNQKFKDIIRCKRTAISNQVFISFIKKSIKKIIGLENYLRIYSKIFNVKDGIFKEG